MNCNGDKIRTKAVKQVPNLKRRRIAPVSQAPTVETVALNTAESITKSVAQARCILDRRGHSKLEPWALFAKGRSQNCRSTGDDDSTVLPEDIEAVALLTGVLTQVPALWPELACDFLIAIAAIRGASEQQSFIEDVLAALPPARELAQDSQAASAAVVLLCLFGSMAADEGHFIAAFRVLRRSVGLARRVGDLQGEERAHVAMEGLRVAALQRWHFHMINDVERSVQYKVAIELAVRRLRAKSQKDLIALDIGTGSGLLALMCARIEGVRTVHACEMNEALCAVAEEVIAMHRQERSPSGESLCQVVTHPIVSKKLEVQQKFDLVFCEIFDAGLLGEHAIPTILHAHDDLLSDCGLIIPRRAQIFGQLIESVALMERFGLVEAPSGMSMQGIRLCNQDRYSCEILECLEHVAITSPMPLLAIDFGHAAALRQKLGKWEDTPIDLPVIRDGTVHALAFWWQVDLDDDGRCQISSAPSSRCNSWEQAVCPVVPITLGAPGIRGQVGSTLSIHTRLLDDGVQFVLAETLEAEHVHGFGKSENADDLVLVLNDEELGWINDTGHWEGIRRSVANAVQSMHLHSGMQVLDLSEGPLPIAALIAERCVEDHGIVCKSVVFSVPSDEAKAVAKKFIENNLSLAAQGRVALLNSATTLQVIESALPTPDSLTHTSLPATLVLCDNIVERNGTLRTGILEDLLSLWARAASIISAAELRHRIRIVPEVISIQLTLVESSELLRRHRVVERPGGIDVACVNVLAVPSFMGLSEAVLKPKRLGPEVSAVALPIGSPDLTGVVSHLAAGGSPVGQGEKYVAAEPFLVRLKVSHPGTLHGIITRFTWQSPQVDASSPDNDSQHTKLSGFVWPLDSKSNAISVAAGDFVVVEARYSPARGLSFNPFCIERHKSIR